MRLLVFSTHRQLRQYAAAHQGQLLPKLLTIADFLDRAIISELHFVDEELRSYYFYEACRSVDLAKLGIDDNFERFLQEGQTLYSFLKEMFLEQVDFATLHRSDTYAEYSEHLQILEQIRQRYKELLASRGLTDIIVLDEYTINTAYFSQFERISIKLTGFLSRFDLSVIERIEVPVEIELWVSRFNLPLARKMFGIEETGVYRIDEEVHKIAEEPQRLERFTYAPFSQRIEQCNYIFAQIEEFVSSGIDPQKIAVILPDPDLKEYLESFDRLDNLNFSMGESFVYSPLYRKLEALYHTLYLKDESFTNKLEERDIEEFAKITSWPQLKEWLFAHAQEREKRVMEEPLFRFERMVSRLDLEFAQLLHLLLRRLQELRFDDVRGGKVTVMEVLESRGATFDGVIVADFNEGVVPKLSFEDAFLNSATRKAAGLPTITDKLALQKHYYYTLLASAKRVALCYVKNEESDASRFLWELPFDRSEEDLRYDAVLYSFAKKPKVYDRTDSFEAPTELSPTMLEILLKCPLRYYLRYEKGIRSKDVGYRGIAIHEAIRKAIQSAPQSPKEYFELIWEALMAGANRYERYTLGVDWYTRLQRFTQEDFALLGGEITTEVQGSRELDGYLLRARADRIIKKDGKLYIYDYKTNNTSGYLNAYLNDEAKLQGEFYAYIWDSDEVYFWDLRNTKLQKLPCSESEAKLREALGAIETTTRKAHDLAVCRFCEFRFGCRGEA